MELLNTHHSLYAKSVIAPAQKQTEVALQNATLKIKKDALQTDRSIKVIALKQRDLPELDQGMVNVTKENEGYRFLPHGIKFDKENNLQIAYDESKLPKGMSAKDIKTYFFDEDTGRWMPLPKIAAADGIVTSKTTHFTDMINAVIQTPDAPQAKAYGATQIKDLKVANPGAKVNLIEAPKASTMGDAQLGYPIETPTGRHGMAPQLGVNYSSGASNSWMGIGWNLSTPSIGIDTRWGVPRYDDKRETETYTIAGQQLAPVAHRSAPVDRTAEKTFHPRVEGSFNKIIRHGSSPKDYWWEVTSKNGTKSFYGGLPGSGVDKKAVLTDGDGHIAHWALTRSVDTYGNTITYSYTKVEDTGVRNDEGNVPGYQLYVSNINYTGFNGNDGAYDVSFIRDRDLKEDRRTDVTIDARLGFKRVTADLLRKVEVKFHDTTFRSYEFVYTTGAFEKTLLSKIKQFDADGALFNTHSFDYFDEVRDENGTYIAYKAPEYWIGEASEPEKEDSTPVPSIPTLPSSGSETTVPVITPPSDEPVVEPEVNTKGLANALKHANENSRVQVDLEGIETHGDSIFHKSKENNGFERDQVTVSGDDLSSILLQTAADGVANIIYPSGTTVNSDNVLAWKAPFSGLITLKAPVALLEDPSDARAAYTDADGVRVTIQHQNSELWGTTIGANDYSLKTPTGVESISVNEGDLILFRIQTLQNSAYDIISWNPSITYMDKLNDVNDANNLPLYSYVASQDSLPKADVLETPYAGNIKITGELSKPVTTDAVTLSLVKFSDANQSSVVWEQTYGADEVAELGPDLSSIDVNANDKLLALVKVQSNVDFKSVAWNPTVAYNSTVDSSQLEQTDTASNQGEVDTYYTAKHALKTSYGWEAPSKATISVEANVPTSVADSGTVYFTVKSEGKLLTRQDIMIEEGVASASSPLSFDIVKGERVFFEYHYSGTFSKVDPVLWTPKVTSNGEAVAVETLGILDVPANLDELFYRGWEEYTYDASNQSITDPIVTDNLQVASSGSAVTLASSLPGVASDTPFNTSDRDEANQDGSAVSTGDSTYATDSSQNDETATITSAQNTLSSSSSLPDEASALSGAKTKNSTVHMSVTVGPNDWNLAQKTVTAGGKFGSSKSDTDGTLAMVDIDGDSLPDQIVISGGGLGYRKNLSHEGIESFAPVKSITGANAFLHSKTSASNGGAEAHFGIFAGYNKSSSTTVTDIYFSDVNGDGLIDIVSKGIVHFNKINAEGVPTFTTSSSTTPNPIDESGELSDGGWIEPQTPAQLAQLEIENPLHDTVRVWRAPEAGTISITAPVHLVQDTSDERTAYTTADGVRVAIQHRGTELWSTRITAEDYATKTPQNISAIPVAKGDRIYFRVQSVFDGMYDTVVWSPKIVYTDKVQSVDANHLPYYNFDITQDFIVSGYDITMPISGTVSVTGTFSKPATSDDVTLRLVKTDTSGNKTTVWQENTGQGAVSKNINLTQSVTGGESYRFVVYSDTNVDWAKISWKPTVTYTQSSDPGISVVDADGNYQLVQQATAMLNTYSKTYKKTPLWIPESSTTAVITPQLSDIPTANGSVVFSIKKDRTLIAKQTLRYENGTLITPVNPISLGVSPDTGLYLEYHTINPELASLLVGHTDINIEQYGVDSQRQAGLYSISQEIIFGPMYRNWGQFVYNGNEGRATQPIIESELNLDSIMSQVTDGSAINAATDEESLKNALDNEGYDPTKSILVPMIPRGDIDIWQGMDPSTMINAATISSSRLGLKYLIEDNLLPTSDGTASIRGINQIVKTKGDSIAIGAGIGPIGGSASKNKQESKTLTQFNDMNGDRYPDIVGVSQVQYTTMLGALEADPTSNSTGEPIFNKTESTSYTLGGTFATGKIDTGGKHTIWAVSTQDPNAGISGNTGTSIDEQQYNLRDINGDGLPDRLYKDGRVALNLGYSFAPIEDWKFGKLHKTKSESEGGGIGINIGHYSIGAGLAISSAKNDETHTLMDLNSDGLLDEAYISGGQVITKLNTGNGFTSEIAWSGATELYKSETKSGEVSATFTYCIPFPPPTFPMKLCFNPGGSKGSGSSHDLVTLSDINGDGFMDFLQSTSADQLGVSTSTIGKTNLLKSVERPLGAKITIDYERSGNTYENPHNKWVLSEVEVFDGHAGDGANTMKQTFEYADGYYDRHEREFYGFAWVTTSDIDTVNADAVYRKNVNHYINDNYYEKGLLDYTKVVNGEGKLYIEKYNAYDTIDIFTSDVLTDEQKKEDDHVTFSQLVQAQTLYYEGTDQAGQSSAMEYVYDQYGNVITQFDLGDISDSNDDWAATLTYTQNLSNYIVSVPTSIKIYDDTGNLLRDREATVDTYGAVTQVRANTGSTTLTSDMAYDQYGNLISITYPPNHKGQRYALNYTMDDVVHTYTTSMSDSFGYTATAGYDYRFGAQTSQTDINNQPITTTVDAKGRIKTITGPLEAGTGTATIKHSYFLDATTPYALTEHYDEGRADTIDTVTFIDGLMRVIQTKMDAAIDADKDGIALDGMSVSGHIIFDSFGRTVAMYYPVTEGLGSKGTFNHNVDGIAPTRTTYDILDRKLKTTLPDGATLTNAYGFGADRDGVTRFHTLSTDANGNKAESFKDVRERITAVLQHNPVAGQDDIWTSYSYNAVNELLQVKDDKGNLTQAIYDLAGRRTHINNPDTGWIESKYDDAGNVVAKITDNLRDQGAQISYVYDYNRLTNINYPNTTSNNVTYSYGHSPAELNAGRITKIVDASGERLFEYGKLGETTKETRTLFTYTATEPKTYMTQYRYDTWNRLRELTYPDGEVVTHSYDSGGKLSMLQGVKGEYSYDYLKALTYDKFGQRVFTKYANDTTATYSYEPERRRLSHLSTSNEERTFIDNTYSYDRMQNILGVSNAAAVPVDSPHFGGETAQSYSYDNLYQLTSAEGSWTTRQGHEHRYTLAMSYDTIGNMPDRREEMPLGCKAKNQNHERLPYEGDSWIEQKGTTYDWTYDHEAKQPHAPTKIGNRTFTYDANGNQTGWENTQNATNRVIRWDEENRISTITDNGHTSYYVYDAGGERSLKRTAQGETFYVNPYFVIREGEVASKHFFAGSQRIATKLTKQESQTVHSKGGNDKPAKIIYEKEQYFYHPDHLGSSSFVTDEKGEVYEHLEYFPYGEAFAHEHSNTKVTPYRFTGKELDEVTGLYYYGARYYDPRTSVWQSPDPILDKYMNGQANSGVFNPKNLSLFSHP